MDFIRVILLGIIEGLTEFLPISSTGHLILADQFIKLSPANFSNAFMVIIQLGAILSVVVVSFNKLNPFKKANLTGRLKDNYQKLNPQSKAYYLYKFRDKNTMDLWKKILIALIPAVILGLLLDDLIDKYLFSPLVVASMLIFWGIIIIVIENKDKNRIPTIESFDQMGYRIAFLIGLFQCLALIPGTSRSAATIIGALLLGSSRIIATEFSFYLAIPTMFGATLLKVVKNLEGYTPYQWLLILIGSIVSFIVAYVTIKRFLDYVKNRDFKIFGYYRIVVGILVIILIMI